jgi:hypothetical protein
MMKVVVLGTTALFLTASSIANAQSAQTSPSAAPVSAEDQKTLTDLRIDLVKAALQLTPAQEKLWPPVESAIRARAEDRKGRIAKIQETVGRRADESRAEVLRNRDPIAFLQRRSEALAQRSADLDKLAEAWQPLYKTLSPEQRQRMGALAILVLHDMSDPEERRRLLRNAVEDEDWRKVANFKPWAMSAWLKADIPIRLLSQAETAHLWLHAAFDLDQLCGFQGADHACNASLWGVFWSPRDLRPLQARAASLLSQQSLLLHFSNSYYRAPRYARPGFGSGICLMFIWVTGEIICW